MKGLKIIGIIPLKGCKKKYRKSLQIGQPYQFYRNYKIELNAKKSKVKSVQHLPSQVPEDLYRLDNGIRLNFSAVVGENGSGKSTLFELFYYLVFLIGTEKKQKGEPIIEFPSSEMLKEAKAQKRDLETLKKVLAHNKKAVSMKLEPMAIAPICHNIVRDHQLKISTGIPNTDEEYYQLVYEELCKKYKDLVKAKILEQSSKEHKIRKGVRLSVLYTIDRELFEVNYSKQGFCHYRFENPDSKIEKGLSQFQLQQFFYSISLNYSHHALNSKTMGKWINRLFHKNDAYTTPVVINPMRDEGNFNINKELNLSKERLMANLVYGLVQDKKSKLLKKYTVASFIFKPKSSARPLSSDSGIEHKKMKALIREVSSIENYDIKRFYWEEAIWYLESKSRRIERNYPLQIQQFAEDNNIDREDGLDFFIRHDLSHITKKIRQTFNFLRASNQSDNINFWKYTREGNTTNDKTAEELLKWIDESLTALDPKLKKEELNPSELIEHALPGFFNIDFLLQDEDGSKILFSALSSGEQQMILNVNAITYHLYNLQSVHHQRFRKVRQRLYNRPEPNHRVAYKNVNVILDEVELYYHPDMQRKLVAELRNAFELVKKPLETGIQSINVCFLTHSPFILSDIPRENVLLLKAKDKERKQTPPEEDKAEETFAANIHDLLANGFFMQTLMGEFAAEKIEQLIHNIEAGEINEQEEQLIQLIGDNFLKAGIRQFKANQNDQN